MEDGIGLLSNRADEYRAPFIVSDRVGIKVYVESLEVGSKPGWNSCSCAVAILILVANCNIVDR